jgi:hypothetical protein
MLYIGDPRYLSRSLFALLVKVFFFLGEVLLGMGGVIALHHAVIVTSA